MKTLTPLAKNLRNNLTEAGKLLWYYLRRKQFGLKFKRQTPIGNFIVDFVCFPLKLIIEVDGEQHAKTKNKTEDQLRDEWLKRQGFVILRFWNNEVLQNIDGVLEKIYKHCQKG